VYRLFMCTVCLCVPSVYVYRLFVCTVCLCVPSVCVCLCVASCVCLHRLACRLACFLGFFLPHLLHPATPAMLKCCCSFTHLSRSFTQPSPQTENPPPFQAPSPPTPLSTLSITLGTGPAKSKGPSPAIFCLIAHQGQLHNQLARLFRICISKTSREPSLYPPRLPQPNNSPLHPCKVGLICLNLARTPHHLLLPPFTPPCPIHDLRHRLRSTFLDTFASDNLAALHTQRPR